MRADLIKKMFLFENNELEPQEVIDFFQELIDSDLAWKLEGEYAEDASYLIENGYCKPKNPPKYN